MKNNGWIKIKNVLDLPIKEDEYWCVTKDKEVRMLVYNIFLKEWCEPYNCGISYTVTHWQRIVKPKLPFDEK